MLTRDLAMQQPEHVLFPRTRELGVNGPFLLNDSLLLCQPDLLWKRISQVIMRSQLLHIGINRLTPRTLLLCLPKPWSVISHIRLAWGWPTVKSSMIKTLRAHSTVSSASARRASGPGSNRFSNLFKESRAGASGDRGLVACGLRITATSLECDQNLNGRFLGAVRCVHNPILDSVDI